MQEAHDPFRAFRHPDYWRLLTGNFLANIAGEIQAAAVYWELYRRTHSNLYLGFVGLVQILPILVLALPAGHFADRHSRKVIVSATLGVATFTSWALALLAFYEGPIELIYICLFLSGVCRAFSAPARWALVSQVVPDSALANAVIWNGGAFQVACVLGSPICGLVIHAFGEEGYAFALAGVSALAGSQLFLSIRSQQAHFSGEQLSLASLGAGVKFVWRSKLILATITLDLLAVLFGGATALLPAFANDILQVGPAEYGWLRAATPLGALCMSITLAALPPLRRAGPTLIAAVAGFGVATIVFGLSNNYFLSFTMLALTGAFDSVSVVIRGTLVQLLTPNDMRGRVSAVNSIFINSSNYLGDFESGVVGEYFGAVASAISGGVGTLLVVGLVTLIWPQLPRLGRLMPREKEVTLEPKLDTAFREIESSQSPPRLN